MSTPVATRSPALTAFWWTETGATELVIQLTSTTHLDLLDHQLTETADRISVRLSTMASGPEPHRPPLTAIRLGLHAQLGGREVQLVVDGQEIPVTVAPEWAAPAEEPRYYWAKSKILTLLAKLGPDTALPSERELAAKLGVARMTLRQAMIELTSEGRVYRKRGSGTYVARPKLVQDLREADCDRVRNPGGSRPARCVVRQEYLVAGPELAVELAIEPDDLVLHLQRLLGNGADALLLESAYLPVRRFRGLTTVFQPGDSLSGCLERHYGVVVSRTEDQVSAALCNPHEASLLDVAPTVPMLALERTAYDRDGVPVQRTRSLLRGDRFSLLIHYHS